MAKRTCSIEGCDKPHHAHGLCSSHYHRGQTYGVPMGGQWPLTPAERLDARTDRSDIDGCWLFTPSQKSKVYPVFTIDRRGYPAHRVAYELAFGPVPDGLIVRHRCDNPLCIRPDHLVVGTHWDNSRDRVERGRSAHLRGSLNGAAKLTESDVVEILRLIATGKSQVSIAAQFGVSKMTISFIHTGKQWKHVPRDQT